MLDAFRRFTEDVKRNYGEFDKNVMGGMLPGGAARSTIPVSNTVVTTSTPSFSNRGEGRAAFIDTRSPMERAPIGQPMVLNGKKGYKHADGTWKEGTPDGATIQAQPRGIIPVPTNSTSDYAYAGFAKSLAGPVGQAFDIQKPQAQTDFEDKTKNVVNQKADGTIVFNRPESQLAGNEDEYDALGKDLGNKVLGRYVSTKNTSGTDVARDEFDTNQSVGYHLHGLLTGKTPKDKDGNQEDADRLISGFSALHKTLDHAGWTNPSPYGANQVVGTPGANDNFDFENVISEPQSRPTPPAKSPAMQAYEVAVGDTLTAIAAEHGLSIDEIARKNNISNVNNISVGQQLKL